MIKFTVRNRREVAELIRTITKGSKRVATKAMAEYFVGNEHHGLAHDDPYKQTTRRRVYGQQWESDKQRKYVMAKIRSGEIVLGHRARKPTYASGGYAVKESRDGYTIVNPRPSAFWSRVWAKWPRWRHYNKVLEDNMKGAMRAARWAVGKLLRQKGAR